MTKTDPEYLTPGGLMDNIRRGLLDNATESVKARAMKCVAELRKRLTSLERTAERHYQEHRNDRYDGLA